ncbi:hypothetical protein KY346_06775 [Candidatus Woesearchaeota archaeon]|nr:hypothetical protein [Candidatus Woesearchaeota archaeon]
MKLILTILDEIGEGTEPVLDKVLEEFEAKYEFHCGGCDEKRRVPLKGTFRNQIYEDDEAGAAREIAVLQIESARLLQCGNCSTVYILVTPEPTYQRTVDGEFDDKAGKAPVPKIEPEYDASQLERDIEKSKKEIKLNIVGVPEKF